MCLCKPSIISEVTILADSLENESTSNDLHYLILPSPIHEDNLWSKIFVDIWPLNHEVHERSEASIDENDIPMMEKIESMIPKSLGVDLVTPNQHDLTCTMVKLDRTQKKI